jgi:cephalosporin-C deacetylase-like acetyl esterase
MKKLIQIQNTGWAFINSFRAIAFVWLLCSASYVVNAQETKFVEREVTFKTEDGWVIHGVLTTPPTLEPGEKIAGAVLVPSPHHDRDIYGHNGYPSIREVLEKAKIATLRFDIRGRGTSAEPRDYWDFTEDQKARVSLDVTAAIEFLCQQNGIDQSRIGIVTETESADAAVIAGTKDARVRAMILLSGRMSQAAKDAIKSRQDLAILGVVSKEDRVSFADLADAYRLSPDPASSLMIHDNIGLGNAMFIMNMAKHPDDKLEVTVGEWLVGRLKLSSESREVTFQSSDGWKLSGTLRIPANVGPTGAPGIVFVHSNLSDRYVFDHLEKSLAAAGFATLNFDFRGRGKSRNKGSYFDLSQAEKDKGNLDVTAALDHLSSLKGVDKNRLIVVATSVGVRYGIKAAITDDRIKAFVMLGGLPQHAEVQQSKFPILFVSSSGIPQIAKAFREFYEMTKAHGSYLVEFDVGGVGYHLFDLDDSLEPLIVRWLKPQFLSH